MELPRYFSDFLAEIRLTAGQIEDCRTGHTTLRNRLLADDTLKKVIVNTFLQGSYRRATAVRPKGGSRADVDVIVVTKLDRKEHTPQGVLDLFLPFLKKHYDGKYAPQDRSFAIELTYVDLDVVVTAAPSESEMGILADARISEDETPEAATAARALPWWLTLTEGRMVQYSRSLAEQARRDPAWKLEPLWIPDREVKAWTPTHPLEQIRWTWEKNKSCNGHYVNVVKTIKWWRRLNAAPKYPKGYPVEHLIGVHCPDGIKSVAAGVTLTLEAIVSAYQWHANNNSKPSLPDHGVPGHDVFRRVSAADFAGFYALVVEAAMKARQALDAETVRSSANKWRNLLGNKFPEPPEGDDDGGGDGGDKSGGPVTGGFTRRTEPSIVTGGRFG